MFREDDQRFRGGKGMQDDIQEDKKNFVEQIPEVFFIGQIVGGCDFEHNEGLFCEMLPDCGEFWDLVQPSGKKQILTQSSYKGNQHMFVWSHPIDLHYTTSDINGWPRCIFKVWVLDGSNKMDICSYGICNLPKTPGFHQIYIDTWSPVGDWKMGNQQFFLGNQPQIPNQVYNDNSIPYELLANGQNRQKLLGRSNGRILIEIECILRNLIYHNETNQEPQEHEEYNRDMK